MYLVYIRLLKARKQNEKRMNSLHTCIDMLPSTLPQNQKHLNSTTATHTVALFKLLLILLDEP